jgi:hypothetical protein
MLVESRYRRPIFLLSGIAALLTAVSATTSLASADVYRGVISEQLTMGSLGFDVMSLLASVGLVGCLMAIERGHERWWLVWLGVQAYLAYAYALYAFGLVYTRLYFLYIAILTLSVFALAAFREGVGRDALRKDRHVKMPRRTMGVFLVALAIVLALIWGSMLLSAIAYHEPLPAATVIVLDLAFALPLLAIVGAMLVRRRPLGDFLATAVFTMAAAITLGVAVGELFRPAFGDELHLDLMTPFLLPGLACLAFAIVAFRRVSASLPRAGR